MHPTAESVTDGIDLSGQVALVTGASSGLGKEVARVLALRGARVLLACRNEEKGRAVAAELGAGAEVRVCDLSSMASVEALVDGLGSAVDRVYLNAGVFGLPYRLTDEGYEYTYASNYLGHFLLVNLLLERGLLAPTARIIATFAEAVRVNPLARPAVEMLVKNPPKPFSNMMASPNSKVLLALMMRAFPSRVAGGPLAGVTFNAADPGMTKTDNVNQLGAVLRVLGKAIAPLLMKPVGEGAAVLAWLGTAPELEGVTTKTFVHSLKEATLPKRRADPELAEKVWAASLAALSPTPPLPA